MKKKSLFGRVCVLALMFTAFIALFARLSTIPTTQAAGAGPLIHWDSTMIYAGQNNGYPWGPVGENASVSGANFIPGQQLTLVLVQGDSNNNKMLCKKSSATVGNVTTSADGTFHASFSWPSAAGQVNSEYSICSILTSDGQIVSNADGGPFTVLTANPASISTTANSPMPGSMITVNGQNWVPPQTLTVVIVNQSHIELTSAQAPSTGLNSGTFSISMTIPTNAVPGTYHIVGSSNGNNNLILSTSQSFTIVPLQPTLTPTPSPTATPTASATATDTPVATATAIATDTPVGTATSSTSNNGSTPGSTDNSSGGGGPSGIVLGLFIAIAILLLAGIGLVIFIVLQRLSSPRRSPGGGPPGSGGYPVVFPGSGGSFNAYGQAMPPGEADFVYPMQQSGANYPAQQVMQQSGSVNAFDQSFQQSGPYPSGYGQPMPMQPVSPNQNSLYAPSYAQPTVAYASACRNCGRPLMPNDPRCITCGMPT